MSRLCTLVVFGSIAAWMDSPRHVVGPPLPDVARTTSNQGLTVSCSHAFGDASIRLMIRPAQSDVLRTDIKLDPNTRLADMSCDGLELQSGQLLIVILVAVRTGPDELSHRLIYGDCQKNREIAPDTWQWSNTLIKVKSAGAPSVMSVKLMGGDSVIGSVTTAERLDGTRTLLTTHWFVNHCLLGGSASVVDRIFQKAITNVVIP